MITYKTNSIELELGSLTATYSDNNFVITDHEKVIFELSKNEIEQLRDVDSAELLLPEQYLIVGLGFYVYSNIINGDVQFPKV